MKNKKVLIFSLTMSFVICLVFVCTGIKVVGAYLGNRSNWHFSAALFGTIGFAFLLIVCILGFYVIVCPKKFQNLNLLFPKK